MNAIELLKADHDKVQALFQQYRDAETGPSQQKRQLAEQIFSELEVHSALEEEIFYPAVQAKAEADIQDLVADSVEDHHAVKELIAELRTLDPGDEEYEAKLEELRESVEEHVSEEEDEMFPEAEELLSDGLERLGSEMEERKRRLTASKP
jgi:iron-sulfur cluster repair protein YtfE (RIC family)